MSNEIKITVTSQNQTKLDQLSKDAKKTGQEVGDGLKKGFNEGEQASAKAHKEISSNLDKTTAKAKTSGDEGGRGYGEGFAKAVESAKDGPEGAIEGMLGKLGESGGALAAGTAIGGLLLAGMAQSMEQTQIGGLLVAQTGATANSAADLGRTAGKIFTDNFGSSLEDVSHAMKAVFDNHLIDVNANKDDIRQVTETAMTASQVVEEDVGRVARAAQQLVRTGLADNITAAMDMITHASQQGLNASEDLLDTITEYSTKFRDLGLSGQEAFGLVSQAVAAGARDTDTAADALKEFAIRAEDGSQLTARGFQTIGLNATQMGNMIAAGGGQAHQALELTLNALRNIHDPIVRDQAAVDLFGTKAEDLGNSLYAMNLDTAQQKFGDFAQSTADAARKIAESTPPIETAWKNLQAGIGNAFDAATHSDAVTDAYAKFLEGQAKAKGAQDDEKKRAQEAADAWKNQGGAISKVVETLDKYIGKQHEIASGVLDLSAAQIGYQKALDDAAASAKDNGKTLDLNTEKGRNNQTALNDLAKATYDQMEAMEQQGATASDLAGFMGGAREQFITLAEKMGLSATQANALADKLRLIPGDYTARVGVDAAQAANAITTIHGRLVDLTSRTWIASVAVTGAGSVGGGRYFAGMAHGGVVGGGFGHAAEGGPRGTTVITDEYGPELKMQQDGSMIVPAGMSRAIMSGWMGHHTGSDGGRLRWEIGPGADSAMGTLIHRLLRQGDLQLVARNGDTEYVVTGA